MIGRLRSIAVAGVCAGLTFCGTLGAQAQRGDSAKRHRPADSLRQRTVTVDGRTLNAVPAFTLEQAMQGRIAGVVVNMNDGAPWSDGQIQIRGASTLVGDPSPLVIVDGVQTTNSFSASTGAFGGAGDVARLRSTASLAAFTPFEIERVEVLKGPVATSLFGARGAAGVLLITTRRAAAGASPWRAMLRTGGAEALRLPGSRCFASVGAAVAASPGDSTAIRTAAAANGGALPCNTPLAEYFGAQALSSEAAVQWAGRIAGTALLGSAARKAAPGASAGSGMTRTNLRLNADRAITDRLTAQLSTGVSLLDITRGGGSADAATALLTYPSWRDARVSGPDGTVISALDSPFAQLRDGRDDGAATRTTGSLVLRYDAVRRPGTLLRVEAVTGLDRSVEDDDQVRQFFDAFGSGGTRRALTTTNMRSRMDNHVVRARLETVYARQLPLVVESGVTLDRQSFSRAGTTDFGGLSGSSDSAFLESSIAGAYATVSTALLDRSLELGASVRSDRLRNTDGVGATFPAVHLRYLVPLVPAGLSVAVRGAWGESGSLGALSTRPFQVASTNGFGEPIAPQLERRRDLEGGIELSRRDGRFALSYTGYRSSISPLHAGSTALVLTDAASMRTTGHELTMDAQVVQRRTVRWDTRVIVSRSSSSLTRYEAPGVVEEFTDVPAGPIQVLRSGERLGDFSRLLSLPVVRSTPTFDAANQNVIRVGPLTLQTLLDWRQGGALFNATLRRTDVFRTSADFDRPSPMAGTSLGDFRRRALLVGDSTGLFLTPGSFVRLREVALRYAIPSQWSARAFGSAQLGISLTGRNLALWTSSAANDPEFSAIGTHPYARIVSDLRYPTMRQVFVGVDLGI